MISGSVKWPEDYSVVPSPPTILIFRPEHFYQGHSHRLWFVIAACNKSSAAYFFENITPGWAHPNEHPCADGEESSYKHPYEPVVADCQQLDYFLEKYYCCRCWRTGKPSTANNTSQLLFLHHFPPDGRCCCTPPPRAPPFVFNMLQQIFQYRITYKLLGNRI